MTVFDPDDPKKYDVSSLNPIPNDNDRVQSFVVHFFDGDINQVRSFNTFAKFGSSTSKNSLDGKDNPDSKIIGVLNLLE